MLAGVAAARTIAGDGIAMHLIHIGNYGFNLEHVASWEYEPAANGSAARLVLYAVVPIGGLKEPNAFAFMGIRRKRCTSTCQENPSISRPRRAS